MASRQGAAELNKTVAVSLCALVALIVLAVSAARTCSGPDLPEIEAGSEARTKDAPTDITGFDVKPGDPGTAK